MIKIKVQKKLHTSSGHVDLNVNLHIKENEFVALSGVSGKQRFCEYLQDLKTPRER